MVLVDAAASLVPSGEKDTDWMSEGVLRVRNKVPVSIFHS